MDSIVYAQAARNVAGEPVSIETDGTIWADSDQRNINQQSVEQEYERLIAEREAAKASALAKLEALGLTTEEAQAIAGI